MTRLSDSHQQQEKSNNLQNNELCRPARLQSENKKKSTRDKDLDLARDLKKIMGHEDDCYTNCVWCAWDNPQKIGKETGNVVN